MDRDVVIDRLYQSNHIQDLLKSDLKVILTGMYNYDTFIDHVVELEKDHTRLFILKKIATNKSSGIVELSVREVTEQPNTNMILLSLDDISAYYIKNLLMLYFKLTK